MSFCLTLAIGECGVFNEQDPECIGPHICAYYVEGKDCPVCGEPAPRQVVEEYGSCTDCYVNRRTNRKVQELFEYAGI